MLVLLLILFFIAVVLMPLHAALATTGILSTLAGILYAFNDLVHGIYAMAIGVGMIMASIVVVRHKEAKDADNARETAERINRMMRFDLPDRDDY
ncbi:MAG: hypothetical protein ACYTHJ_15650 [Planctomycetota bacterium]|jgi:hypothetical protein